MKMQNEISPGADSGRFRVITQDGEATTGSVLLRWRDGQARFTIAGSEQVHIAGREELQENRKIKGMKHIGLFERAHEAQIMPSRRTPEFSKNFNKKRASRPRIVQKKERYSKIRKPNDIAVAVAALPCSALAL